MILSCDLYIDTLCFTRLLMAQPSIIGSMKCDARAREGILFMR
ncbi:hypothetical protein BN1221_01726c [Brenneria goodwinii]|uniref:Uncharacterized protein n=1 Tax=Brenneria goodwinii TaxID=1109412 RepID=A0A0G4JTR3_9GAMM|nr:hypothetical protein BN1221_01726c [Brenneria goodwinii]